MKKELVGIVLVLMLVAIAFAGCTGEEDKEEDDGITEHEVKQYSVILTPQLVETYSGSSYANYTEDASLIQNDDGIYLSLSGDCMNRGRGVFASKFKNQSIEQDEHMMNNLRLINVTLIVKYQIYYDNSSFFEWAHSSDSEFVNAFQPQYSVNETTEQAQLFGHSYDYTDIENITIHYFNPRGGFVQYPIKIDFIWLEVDYEY